MVRPERFELPTYWFVASRSIQLSYGRALLVSSETIVRISGFIGLRNFHPRDEELLLESRQNLRLRRVARRLESAAHRSRFPAQPAAPVWRRPLH